MIANLRNEFRLLGSVAIAHPCRLLCMQLGRGVRERDEERELRGYGAQMLPSALSL